MPSEIEQIKEGVARSNAFIEERYDPLSEKVDLTHEETERMKGQIEGILSWQKDNARQALLKERDGVPRVQGGKYDGLDAFEMGIVRSIARKQAAHPETSPELKAESEAWLERADTAARALDSTSSGAGDELVPTGESSQLWRDVHLQTSVASLFSQLQMPTNPFEVPLDLGDINWYPGTPNVATKSTDPTTAKRSITAYELAAALAWAYELDEDGVLAMMPELRSAITRSAAELIDDVVLNADTTAASGISADGATILSTSAGTAQYILGFDGLRHIPLIDNTGQAVNHNAAVSDDMFNEIRTKLDKYGVRPGDLAWIMDLNTYIRAQTVSNFRTLDKLGPMATVLTGQLGAVEGIPVIVSEQLKLADTDGKVTSGGNAADTGTLMIVNKSQYTVGFKRQLLVESTRDIQKRQTIMVASMRIAFEGRNANSSDTAVAMSYDITGVS